MSLADARLLRINDRVVDLARREIMHEGRLVEVEPKAFDLLRYLIASRDRLVARDDLIAHVWRGRLVSDSAVASALSAARAAIGDNGRDQRVIRTSARQGVRLVADILPAHGAAGGPSAGPAALPAVAVMPFRDLGHGAGQACLVDGLAEDLVAALARIRSLRAVPRSATIPWKGGPFDARYVLEGSIRKSREELRVAVQLVDAVTGSHLWSGTFEGSVEDVFALQDRVVAGVVDAIVPAVQRVEMERVRRKPPADFDAYDAFLRGVSLFREFKDGANREARACFYRAIALDPAFPAPYGFATHTFAAAKLQGWDFDEPAAAAEVRRLSREVAEVGADDGWALATTGFSLAWICRDHDLAASFGDAASDASPGQASVWIQRGAIAKFRGEHAAAIDLFARARRISPVGPEYALAQGYLALALLFAGRPEEAASCAAHAASRLPTWLVGPLGAAAACATLGRLDSARAHVATLNRLHPGLRCGYVRNAFSYRRRRDGAQLAAALGKAGLAE